MVDNKVSIIIPTIDGREKLLDRALQSVYNQTYENKEIIIVSEGKPAQEQRRIGVNRATGKYIAFLDDDDYWSNKDYLKTMINYMQQHNLVMVSCSYYDERIKAVRTPQAKAPEDLLISFSNLETSATVFTKEAYEEAGGIDTRFKSEHNHDLFYRIAKQGKFGIIRKVMVVKGYTGKGIGTNRINKLQGYVRFHYKYIKDIFKLSFQNKLFVAAKFIFTVFLFALAPNSRSNLYEKFKEVKDDKEKL